ncbi:MAG: hypothetical protein KME25_33725 [Symplocastrum torsivum CPER-KK1]|jgi:hypothetical protein|uniref:Uncharacterized protein n=1 Tax=Symplocastrum torsivum CPER-KK1 TaxID=450513 RepID=A0A951PUN6_9CYAN|nr:hypothetical protein [Symplocastrum torsivum CPER-KK1]
MPSLRDATKARAGKKAAKRVAKPPKAAKPAKTSTPAKSGSTPTTTITPTKGNAIASVTVPGLPSLIPDQIAAQMPQFSPESYQVSDPLNPPTSIPQVSQTDYDVREGIYQGGIRALKLTGLGFDLTREKFTVIGKQAKAFGAGIKAATALEAVKGDYLDYQSQVENTSQKSIALGTNQHKTTVDQTKAGYSEQEMNEKLEQARIAADLASEQTREKQSSLDQFRKQLTGLVAAK